MVFKNHLVVTFIIVIAIVKLMVCIPLYLGCIQTKVIDLLIVKDLKLLIVSEIALEELQSLLSGDGVLNIFNFNGRRGLIGV